MRILVSLPLTHPNFPSIDKLLDGTAACSGTIGAIVRSAEMISQAGHDVTLSGASKSTCTSVSFFEHKEINAEDFDQLIVHQSHWNGQQMTFGNKYLNKTNLFFQNNTSWKFANTFLSSGGRRVVTCSNDSMNYYRAIPHWLGNVTYIYNSYCSVFTPNLQKPQAILLFIGAITPTKGFREVMQIWSHLVSNNADIGLHIAGSIGIHQDVAVGPLGIAEAKFEEEEILPWLATLSKNHHPVFLGALTPAELNSHINRSWAVIVNPSWSCAETFCISAVEAQACNRTVFSVDIGGLKETVYRGALQSLASGRRPEDVSHLILYGLSNKNQVEENGRLAGEFVRSKFVKTAIQAEWMKELTSTNSNVNTKAKSKDLRSAVCDFLRWSGTGIAFEEYVLRRT